jgi:hypothetical protein
LADRDAADAESKREQLKRERAELDNQRAALESERNALASNQKKPVYLRTESTTTDDAAEPVYQGKPATYEVFYDKLQDDGDWIESDDYGYIWQPRVSRDNRRWRPYTDGRWVETDRGWTWESNERFGWATYHYGRWVNLADTGWCWVPGDEWAPAWVSWRSSDRYVGWAPLPPEARIQRGGRITASDDVGYDTGPEFYTFVDTQDFGEETYVGRVVEPERNVTIINQTVNVTNITHTETNVYNYGPDVEVVRRHSRRPIEHYELELNRDPRFDRDSGRPQAHGDRLSIVAPLFAAVSQGGGNNDVRPSRVERKVAKVERDNGWRGVRHEQREAVKADLQKQADRQAQAQQADRERQRLIKTHNDARLARRDQAAAATPATQQAAAAPEATATPSAAAERRQATPPATPMATPERTPNAQTKTRREALQRRQAEQAAQANPTTAATPERSATPDVTSQRAEPSATPVERSAPTPDRNTTPSANRSPINEQQKARREAQRREATQATPAGEGTRSSQPPFPRPSAPADASETTRPQRQPQAQQAEPDTNRQQAAAQAAREQQQQNAQAQAVRERRQAAQQAPQQQAAPVEREVTRPRQAAPDTSADNAPATRQQQQPDAQGQRAARPEHPAQHQPKANRGNPTEATTSPTPQ